MSEVDLDVSEVPTPRASMASRDSTRSKSHMVRGTPSVDERLPDKSKKELDQIRERIRKTIDDSRADTSQLSHIRLKYGHIPEMDGLEDFMHTKTSFAFSQGPISYNSRRLHARNKDTYAESMRSLSPGKNPSVNVGLRERDSFLSIFPGYGITKDRFEATSKSFYKYPEKTEEGKATHEVNRDFHHKVDFMKRYTESMLKVKNMRRVIP